ncbi:SseB family protein [Micromonospora sp. LOL_024]|uniref:SseB family protein n=1 Tax=Micromonospora sp. LOL_024 TaxID=3345412 RepID=UPI003A8899AD
MTEWEPATEAEAALRDALLGNDQQLYFRILSSVELLLPVSAQAAAGRAPAGWGTWTTGGRTHVLAFTSAEAMRVCLGEHVGPSRRAGYAELATSWPDHEWWLAVNPGLPIEGYLPAWYVSQLSRGDVRLPGRTLGARARLERVEALNRSRGATPGAPVPSAPAAANGTPKQRPPGIRPSRPTVPPVPANIHRPEVPVVVPGPTVQAARQEPAGWAPAPPGQDTPDNSPNAGDDRPGAVGGDRRGGLGGGPEGSGGAPRRRPTPFRSEDPGLPEPGRPTTSAAPGPPANGRTAETGAEQTPPRSYFEPAAGRSSHRGDRLADRAAPPARFRSGQPFPRRGSAGDTSSEENPRAFVFTEDDRSADRTRTEATEEAPQPLPAPGPAAQETTRPLRVTTPAGWAAPAGVEPTAGGGEAAQALPRRRPTDDTDGEEQPVSAAEPVSGPPATRRGFMPIVIEGTIIEARDLAPANGVPPMPAPRPHRPSGDTKPEVTVQVPTAESEPKVPAPTLKSGPSGPSEPSGPSGPSEPVATAPPEPTVPVQTVIPEPEVGAEPVYASTSPAAARVHPSPAAPSPTVPPVIATPTAEAAPTAGGTGSAASAAPELSAPAAAGPPFQPANAVEEDLLGAAGAGSTDTFLSTLLLAWVLLPVAADSAPGSRPGDPGFVWPAVELDGQTFVVAYTSPQRLADHTDPAAETVQVRFVQLIRRWPDTSWSFAVNPGTPVGAKLPGEQIVGLATWAADLGLGDDSEGEPEASATASVPSSGPRPAVPPADPARPIVMQKAIAPSQLGYYLERGYDRVSGFVHRASELAHLTTPTALYQALGLSHPESPFAPDAEQVYLLRWPAYRPSLYRIPYGGQHEAAMRAMEGWVIERPPFRGNGFAPGESSDVLAEFKVDSVRLPHGAQLLRIDAAGVESLVAVLDADTYSWQQVGEQ